MKCQQIYSSWFSNIGVARIGQFPTETNDKQIFISRNCSCRFVEKHDLWMYLTYKRKGKNVFFDGLFDSWDFVIERLRVQKPLFEIRYTRSLNTGNSSRYIHIWITIKRILLLNSNACIETIVKHAVIDFVCISHRMCLVQDDTDVCQRNVASTNFTWLPTVFRSTCCEREMWKEEKEEGSHVNSVR